MIGKSTNILPKSLSRYRALGYLGTNFRFHRVYTSKTDADRVATDLRSRRKTPFLVRVIPIKAKVRGTQYNYAIYIKRGRDRKIGR